MTFDLTDKKMWNPLFPTGMLKTLQVPNSEIITFQEPKLEYSLPMRDAHVRKKEKLVEKYLVEEF